MNIKEDVTVGGMAASEPDALQVFQKLGIDFCCGGKKPLAEALAEKGLQPEKFYELLEAEKAGRKESAKRTDFTAISSSVLSAYIEDTHHDYLRRVLPEISLLMLAVIRAHGKNHRELFEVYRLFGQLKTDLEQHLVKEETMLFPALAQNGTLNQAISDLAAEIIGEHEAAGELLAELHEITDDFAVPPDACQSYKKVYNLLPELENDLHQHIHLENNILLKDLYFRHMEEPEDEK
jgi:regulator of cell morphogenesis and NO signaling